MIRVLLLTVVVGVAALLWQVTRDPAVDAPTQNIAPRDAAGWADLGATRLDAGDGAAAAAAYRAATRLAPQTARHWSGLGEALALRDGGRVSDDALAAFRRASALDAADERARYFLALHRADGGDGAGAIGDWLALLASMPGGTPWEADLVRQIERAGASSGIAVASRIAAARAAQPRPGRRIDPLALPPR